MQRRRWSWPLALVLLILLLGTSCGLGRGEVQTPTATPRAAGARVVFSAPFRAVLDEGEAVPGAPLQYVGQNDEGIHVLIEGQGAVKKVGDSFNWHGSPAAGVELGYELRVVGVVLDVFQAWGTVEIAVLDPAPAPADLPESAPLDFPLAVATYAVKKGEIVPGTTYFYLGKTDKGAQFGGVEGYAYREIADSLDWSGQLRSNVFVDLTMRVSSIHDDEVTLVGTATVWIFP